MKKNILVALKNTASSRKVVEFLAGMPFCTDAFTITLLNVYRKPSTSEELLGEDFFMEEPARLRAFMEDARQSLVRKGYAEENIKIELAEDPYPTIAEGIIDRFSRGDYFLVVIGRRKKSKSEEFVMGDVSVKLVRALDNTAVLVVKTE